MKPNGRIAVTSLAVALLIGSVAVAATAVSGVRQARVDISPDPSTGLTTEQTIVRNRLLADNRPGALKHLYVIAPKSGRVLFYSTVRGKVTSGSKRISPGTTWGFYKCGQDNKDTCFDGFRVRAGGEEIRTKEVLGDDGTYGSSAPYIYWWDAKGGYHQHFLTEGQIIQISDQPLNVRSVVINAETRSN